MDNNLKFWERLGNALGWKLVNVAEDSATFSTGPESHYLRLNTSEANAIIDAIADARNEGYTDGQISSYGETY